MKFQKFFHISEMKQSNVAQISTDLKKLLTDQSLPFNHIFGDKVRIPEMMNGGSEYEVVLTQYAHDYELDFDQWVGYKKTYPDSTAPIIDTKEIAVVRKNPVKIGKILIKKKQELEKELKNFQSTNFHNPDDRFDVPYAISVRIKHLQKIDALLKISDLKKQNDLSREKHKLVIIYSRAPIDVLRMSDHGTHSCHAETGSYFNCALADAMLNAGIAYLVTAEDYAKITDLQADEIFKDDVRKKEGIVPVARIRIRAVIDKSGHTIAVPSAKIYGQEKYNTNHDFSKQVLAWAKKQDVSDFKWDDVLTLKGGTYQDYGHEVSRYIKELWDKDVVTQTEHSYDNDEFEGNNDEEEQALDSLREGVRETDWERELAWSDTSNTNSFCPLNVEVRMPGAEISAHVRIRYEIDKDDMKTLGINEEDYDDIIEKHATDIGFSSTALLRFRRRNSVSDMFYLEFLGDSTGFDLVDYTNGANHYANFQSLKEDIKTNTASYFNRLGIQLSEEHPEKARARMNNIILKMFGREEISTKGVDDHGEDFYRTFVDTKPKHVMNVEFIYPDDIWILPTMNSWQEERKTSDEVYKSVHERYSTYDEIMHDAFFTYLKQEHDIELDDNIFPMIELRVQSKILIRHNEGDMSTYSGNDNIRLTTKDVFMGVPMQSTPEREDKSITLCIKVPFKEFNWLVDTGQVEKYHKAFEDMVYNNAFDSIGDVSEKGYMRLAKLDEYVSGNKPQYDSIQLDLSQVNNHMSEFDKFCDSILEGLDNMGTGGMATRAKSATPQTGGFGNTSVSSGGMGFNKPVAANPTNKMGATPNNAVATPEDDEVNLNNALTANDHQTVGKMLQMKLSQNPQYFQSPEFQKNQNLKKWSTNPQNQKIIASLFTQPVQ